MYSSNQRMLNGEMDFYLRHNSQILRNPILRKSPYSGEEIRELSQVDDDSARKIVENYYQFKTREKKSRVFAEICLTAEGVRKEILRKN